MTNHAKLDRVIKIQLPIFLLAAIIAGTVTYFGIAPIRRGIGYSPEQPIPFSHQLHAGKMQTDCRYCHIEVERSRHATIPAAEICMNCHRIARTDRPAIKLLTDYFNRGESIPWKRLHRLPDFVYFSHGAHVNNGIDCSRCHGPVFEMERLERQAPLTMGWCLDCHRQGVEAINHPAAAEATVGEDGKIYGPESCGACHR